MITTKEELLGAWVFNESIEIIIYLGTYNVVFNTNNNSYNKIIARHQRAKDYLTYDTMDVYSNYADNPNLPWTNQAYRTIEITDVSQLTNEQEFIAFMNFNAVKQVSKAISLDNLKAFKENCDLKYQDKLVSGKTIKKIYGQDILGSGDISDGLIEMNVNCNHEFEVTGKTGHTFNLAIPQKAQMLIKKLKGQTRRKSLNLFDQTKATNMTYDSTTNSFLMKASGVNLYKVDDLYGTFTIAIQVIAKTSTSTSITLYKNDNQSDAGVIGTFGNINTYNLNQIYIKNITLNGYLRLVAWGNANQENYKVRMWLVKGTYNEINIPPFEPFDNNLVSSKCDFVTIGRNYLNNATLTKENILDNGTTSIDNNWRASDYIALVENQDYSLSFAVNTSYRIAMYDKNKAFIKLATLEGSKGTFKALGAYVRVAYKPNGNTSKVMLNYGTNALPYEDYTETTINFGLELGQYDSLENGTLTKGTSGVVNLGSQSWQEETANALTNTKLYKFFQGDFISAVGTDFITNLNLPIRSDYLTSDTECIAIDKNNTYLRLNKTKDVKQWLTQNNIQVFYQIEPILTKVSQPSGYGVENSGMEIQKTETLPYIIEKVYPVSLRSQLENNVVVDRTQEEAIGKLNRYIGKPIELNVRDLMADASSVYSTFKNMANKMLNSSVIAIVTGVGDGETLVINNDDIIDAQHQIYAIVKAFKVMTAIIWKVTPQNETIELWDTTLNGFNPFNEDLSTIDYRTPGSKELTLKQGITDEDISILAQCGKINSFAFEPQKGMGTLYMPIVGLDSRRNPMFDITMHIGNGVFKNCSISFDTEVKQKWELSWN